MTAQAFCLSYLIFLYVFRLDPTFLARMNMAAIKNQAREIVYDYTLPHPNTDSSKSCHLDDGPSPAKMQPDAQSAYESFLNAHRTKRCVSIIALPSQPEKTATGHAIPRYEVVAEGEVRIYHCLAHCVRRKRHGMRGAPAR